MSLVLFSVAAYAVLAIMIAGSVALAFGYAHANARANAYAAAKPCVGKQQSGCILTSPVDLLDAGQTSGKSTSYWYEVIGDAVPDQTFDLDCSNNEGFFIMAQGLGALTAKSWDGTVISLAYKGASCNSSNAPLSKAQLWLTGLGILASPVLAWLTLLGRRFIRNRRAKWAVGVASAPFFMNVMIFPITISVAGSHAAWYYLPAYAIGAAIAVPLAVAGTVSKQKRAQQRAQLAAERKAAGFGPASSYGSGPRDKVPKIHWYGSEGGSSAAAGYSGRSGRRGVLSRLARSKARTGRGVEPADKTGGASVTGVLEGRPHRHVGRIINFSLLGLVVAGALTVLGFYIPAQANSFAYENAPICTGSATAGCVTRETATVVDTGSYQQGSSDFAYWIEIEGPGIPDTQFKLGGDCPECVSGAVNPGDKITAYLWKGSVVELDADGNTAPGPTTPTGIAADLLSGVYALFGIVVFWLIVMAAVKSRSNIRRHVILCTGFVVLIGACLAFAPLLAEAKPVLWALPLTLLISLFVVTPFYVFVVGMSRRSARKRAERMYPTRRR